jgi:hypothetical protein
MLGFTGLTGARMRLMPATLLLALGYASAPAVLQIDIPRALVDDSCQGRIHASMRIEGRATSLPTTAVTGPDGYPACYHLLFSYDRLLQESLPVIQVDLQVGEQAQSWTPPRGSLYYLRGPAFPVSGNFEQSPPCPASAAVPETRLSGILPYPCRGNSVVRFSLAQPGMARLRVLNLLGEPVETLVAQELAAGAQTCAFHGRGLDNGLYLLVLEAGGVRQTSRLLLMR